MVYFKYTLFSDLDSNIIMLMSKKIKHLRLPATLPDSTIYIGLSVSAGERFMLQELASWLLVTEEAFGYATTHSSICSSVIFSNFC